MKDPIIAERDTSTAVPHEIDIFNHLKVLLSNKKRSVGKTTTEKVYGRLR